MCILLGSGGFRTEAQVRRVCELIRDFFGHRQRILFIPCGANLPQRSSARGRHAVEQA